MTVIQAHAGIRLPEQVSVPVKTPESPEGVVRYLKSALRLEKVSCLSWMEKTSNFSFFQAQRGTEKLFIKWGGKSGSSRNDYAYTRRLYETCPDFFFRPAFCISEKGISCMGMEYVEGRTLEDAIEDGFTLQEKESLVANQFFRMNEGKRRIRFPGRRRLLIKRKAINLLAVILPIRAWRNKVRQLNRMPQF